MKSIDVSLIKPSEEEHLTPIAIVEHAAEPLKSVSEISKMCNYFRSHSKFRDLFLFILGINTGLRVSDILRLRWIDLIDEESYCWRSEIVIQEKKTAHTKSRAVNRHIAINEAIQSTGMEYLTHMKGVSLDKYVFRSESGNGRNINRPIHRNNVEVMLKKAAKACGITVHVSCHTMRKTYAYHTLAKGEDTQRQLLLLQKMLNHSSALQTLTYAGITADEIKKQYESLNLGIGDSLTDSESITDSNSVNNSVNNNTNFNNFNNNNEDNDNDVTTDNNTNDIMTIHNTTEKTISNRKTFSERGSTVSKRVVSISDYRRSREGVPGRDTYTAQYNKNIL